MRKIEKTEVAVRPSARGWVVVAASPHGIVESAYALSSRNEARALVGADGLPEGQLSAAAAESVARFLAGEALCAKFPVDFRGLADFTVRVMKAVIVIPAGATRTYGAIAASVGSPNGARAVGGVMARNPVAPFVPCHRVVGTTGLVGFGGGLELKRLLLDTEAELAG